MTCVYVACLQAIDNAVASFSYPEVAGLIAGTPLVSLNRQFVQYVALGCLSLCGLAIALLTVRREVEAPLVEPNGMHAVYHEVDRPKIDLAGASTLFDGPPILQQLPPVSDEPPSAVITGIVHDPKTENHSSLPSRTTTETRLFQPPPDHVELADGEVPTRLPDTSRDIAPTRLAAVDDDSLPTLLVTEELAPILPGPSINGKTPPSKTSTDEKKRREPRGNQDAKVKQQLSQLDLDKIKQSISGEQIFSGRPTATLGLADIMAEALAHSKGIQVLNLRPAEDLQFVNEEFGRFDWRSFVDSQFSQDTQPVGDSLQISGTGINQVRNDDHEILFGLRKETQFGGRIELGESIGTRDSNSQLLTPPDQGNASLRITFAQELLRDGGRDVVLSRALIARTIADQSLAITHSEISNLLRDVMNSYWGLYQARGNYFIQLSLIKWAEDTLRILESRSKIDAQENSIEQARALLLEARADLENAKAEVLIAQDVIYRLVNSRALDSNYVEIQTVENPQSIWSLDVPHEFSVALRNRPEIAARLAEIRQASVEHHVSLNQLLPRLTFSLESSLNALDGNFDVFGAKSDLFDINPSYQAGLNFEYFLSNRSARARNKRAQLALSRLQVEYEDQIEEIRLDVSRAIRTLNASSSILQQRQATLQARQKEIAFLRVRQSKIPQQGASNSLLLEQVFQAINRLVFSQQAYVTALSQQQIAYAELLRAKGLLLSVSQVPSDIPIAVPSLQRARMERRQNRDEITEEARQRVVLPGIANPLTTRY